MSELASRRKFAVTQIIIGLFTPLFFVKFIFNFSLTDSYSALGYWYFLPVACFILISIMAVSRNNKSFRVSQSGLRGATSGAYMAFILPTTLLFISSATYSGGGANIGLGLLALAAPALVPIFLLLGLKMGESLAQQKSPNPPFERDA